MRAALQVGYGSPETSLRISDVPTPSPGAGHVLVRVRHTTLNRKDLFALQNLSGPGIRPRPPLPHVNGTDCVGEVAEAGAGVTDWAAGDRVVVYGGLYCAGCEYCLREEHTACVHYGVVGEQTWGSHAEYVSVPARNLERVPTGTDLAALACVGGSWTTAWRALVTVARVQPGETVLIVGASGGVGSGAIQIAKLAGCRVIAVVGAEWKKHRALELGVEGAVEYGAGGFRQAVLDATGGRGVDVVLDSVGAATWRESITSMRPFGRMAVCGATSGDGPDISIREVYQHHRQILGAPMGNRHDFRQLLASVLDGRLRPVIHATIPLDDIHRGLRLLDDRAFFGKIVLTA